MNNQDAANLATREANPVIDGRKANVNLAYLGAKPRVIPSPAGKCHLFFSILAAADSSPGSSPSHAYRSLLSSLIVVQAAAAA